MNELTQTLMLNIICFMQISFLKHIQLSFSKSLFLFQTFCEQFEGFKKTVTDAKS